MLANEQVKDRRVFLMMEGGHLCRDGLTIHKVQRFTIRLCIIFAYSLRIRVAFFVFEFGAIF